MKKKLLAVVLTLAMIVSCMPVMASAADKINVDYDRTLNYVALGDSMAVGFGMSDVNELNAYDRSVMIGMGHASQYAYSTVLKNTIGKDQVNLWSGAMLGARADDVINLIDPSENAFGADEYYTKSLIPTLQNCYADLTSPLYDPMTMTWKTEDGKPIYTETPITPEEVNAVYSKKVKNADFITITAGGNNYFAYLASKITPIFMSPEMAYQMMYADMGMTEEEFMEMVKLSESDEFIIHEDLTKFYDKRLINALNLAKRTALASARVVDRLVRNADMERTTNAFFTFFQSYLYTMASLKESLPRMVSYIHEINPDAKIAITGLPYAFSHFKIDLLAGLSTSQAEGLLGRLTNSERRGMIIDVSSFAEPIYDYINQSYKDVATENSSFCRYIDISEAAMITDDPANAEKYPGTVGIMDFMIMALSDMNASHPSVEGHRYIAQQIMKEFSFTNTNPVKFRVDGTDLVLNDILGEDEQYENLKGFEDIKAGAWYQDAVNFLVTNGVIDGPSDTVTKFNADGEISRGMIVTLLYRLDQKAGKKEKAQTLASFLDNEYGKYYYDAVNWAAENGIVNGYSEDVFAPSDLITREQMACILYRYAKYLGVSTSKMADLEYTDNDEISDYAVVPLRWALAENIIEGFKNGEVQPQGTPTRAQAATMLYKFCFE